MKRPRLFHLTHPAVYIPVFGIIVSVWAACPYLVEKWCGYAAGSGSAGQFGDTFGVVNSLFAGLAVFGLILTLLVQYRISHIDGQEARFFQLCDALRSLVATFSDYSPMGRQYSGKPVFKLWEAKISTAISGHYKTIIQNEFNAVSQGRIANDQVHLYDDFFWQHESELGPYFRLLYQLFKFVDESDISQKRRLTDLLRAELSAPECTLLAYNYLTPQGRKFVRYIEQFRLLKHIREGDKYIAKAWFLDRICIKAFEMPGACRIHGIRCVCKDAEQDFRIHPQLP